MHKKRMELLQAALNQGGLQEAVKFLNATVEHRYTGVYALRGGILVSAALHDRGGQVSAVQLQPAPLMTSLSPFILVGSPAGPEPHMHHHCVPIADSHGNLLGTLCHFDEQRRELPDEEFAFLESAAKAIAPYLHDS